MTLTSRTVDLPLGRHGGTSEPDKVHAALERCLMAAGGDPARAGRRDWYRATATLARELLAERWLASRRLQERWVNKRVCYLSMEFLPGRLLGDALRNLGVYESCGAALARAGFALADIETEEADQALGSGGLGRLAACLMDSLATAGIPAYGYGLRFEFGQFAQAIQDGWQVEHPDRWLAGGNAWQLPRPDLGHRVAFGDPAEDVTAIAHDIPACGYGSDVVNTLRVWSARAVDDFDSTAFHGGDHVGALDRRVAAENLTRVLYPSDANEAGRRLRFRQEHFFVSASVQDILAQYVAAHGRFDGGFERLADKVAIAINDTHPALVVPELMRLLIDEHGLPWGRAWELTRSTVHYTNHTLMPEALETWPVHFFETLLPRQLDIIYRINHEYLRDVRARRPGDEGLVQRLSMVDEHGERRIRMAHLAFVGSRRVNGVSQVHTDLMKRTLFREALEIQTGKVVNVTNGVTPRRWLAGANPELAALVTEQIGDSWMADAGELRRLEPLADDAAFRARFRAVKAANKQRLAQHVAQRCGVRLPTDSIFDVHVKRIHEYKRQLMKLLHTVTLYDRLRSGRAEGQVPRSVVFAGKAAPGYAMAKLIVKLIHDVAATVNDDPAIGDRLKLAFLPDYSVSEAQIIIPAADLSEQISLAGTEASGTGNMKLALNGALTMGTLDGANIEILEAVGAENFFAFGLGVEEIEPLRGRYAPRRLYEADDELRRTIDMIAGGVFSPGEPERFRPVVDSLLNDDRFFLLADYGFYRRRQEDAEAAYRDADAWSRSAVLSVARIGYLSSDRAVRDYAEHVWRVQPAERAALGPALVEA